MFNDDLQKRIVDMIIDDCIDSVKNDSTLTQDEKVEKALTAIYAKTIQYNVLCNDGSEREKYVVNKVKDIIGYREQVVVLEDGYQPWLEDVRTSIDWIHRDRYLKYLKLFKEWDTLTIKGQIDTTTDIILDHMANPLANYVFVKKGLVVGDIQSGKTANYIGLINKAFDVGYQLVIVLAGMQNDLRNQTQERLDKEVLGYETSRINPMANGERLGVGKLPEYFADIESLTSRGNSGDYKKRNGVALFNVANSKKVAIVKKNTNILKNLYDDLSSQINLNSEGKFDIPVLIIDDEVDQASVNTRKDPELDPTKINAHIRNIINLCTKVSYVGYTATPFANIYINSTAENENYGRDLFPKDFILYLPKPALYCGVDEFFGTKENTNTDLVEIIDDYEEFGDFLNDEGEFRMTAGDEIEDLASSMKDAIDDYIVASAIRRTRENGAVHNGMMINIAQYKTPATSMRDLVENYIEDLKNQYMYDTQFELNRYKSIYEARFKNKSEKYERFDDWEVFSKEFKNVFELLKVKLLNGDSRDYIDYSTSKQSQIIVIGGNKLSRGITIEGLMISYYLRDPKAYDTAFQMGRWFGYKRKYLDLCRIYTQNHIIRNFIHLMDASNELKIEVKEMNDNLFTPLSFGLKVKTHPTMLPTAVNKMRSATKIKINLSGSRTETTRFSKLHNDENINLVNSFIYRLKNDSTVEFEYTDNHIPVFRNCTSDMILNLLHNYYEGTDGYSKIKNGKKYIETLNQDGELTDWTVVVSSLRNGTQDSISLGGFTINKGYRSCVDMQGKEIRVLAYPENFKYVFEDEEVRNRHRNGFKKNDPEINKYFTNKKGVLAITCVDIVENNNSTNIISESIIGLTLWFPETTNSKAIIDYAVNDVYMRNQYLE